MEEREDEKNWDLGLGFPTKVELYRTIEGENRLPGVWIIRLVKKRVYK